MKLAVLILSWRRPDALPLHAEYWRGAADLYCHVDLKVPASHVPDVEEVHFMPRTEVFWGGWSMVETTLSLVSVAMNRKNYDRFLLISDDSAPVLPLEEMLARLSADRDFIYIHDDPGAEMTNRYVNIYHLDHRVTGVGHVHLYDRKFDDALLKACNEMAELSRVGKKQVQVRHGDQWWALRRDSLTRILDIVQKDHHLVQSFKYSCVPDEQFFHTLLEGSWKQCFMYTAQEPEDPAIFRSAAEIKERAHPRFMFCRKVDCAVPEIADLVRTGR